MKKNHRKKIIYLIIIVILISVSSLFILFPSSKKNTNYNYSYINQSNCINSNSLNEEQFSSILVEEKNGLGTISIQNISYYKKGFTNYTSQVKYKRVNDDISNGTLNITYLGTQFNKILLNATRDYLKDSFIDQNKISIRINESLLVNFNNNTDENGLAGYLIYLPRLTPIEINEIYVNESKLNSSDYAIKEINGYRFIYFNYFNYFGISPTGTFSIDLIFSYNLTLKNWDANQINNDIVVSNKIQNISAEYTYDFEIEGYHYEGDTPDDSRPASDLIVSLKIIPFDRTQLGYTNLQLNGKSVSNINDYLSDNIIYINLSDSFRANNSELSLSFTTDFKIKFYEPVYKTWAIDRLVDNLYIRERIYFPSVIEGPSRLIVRISFFEPTILNEQIIDSYTQFERPITQILSERDGIKIISPVLIKGELGCPLIIKYQATNNFQVIIRDNFDVPLSGLKIRLFYNNKPYGTYISNNRIQPIAPLTTNQNGEINLAFLPNGIYAIAIFKNDKLEAVKLLNTYQAVYDFKTEIPHIPIVIIIFGSISILIIFIGVIFYLRNYKENLRT
jgi:hypothetical protein